MIRKKFSFFIIPFCTLLMCANCSKSSPDPQPAPVTPTPVTPVVPGTNDMDYWLTKADQSALLQKQADVLSFTTATNSYPEIEVDSSVAYQQIDGFGYTFTGGSAQLIKAMGASQSTALLTDLFGTANMGVSCLRISVGASDLSPTVYSYDDMPAGSTDPTLANFSLGNDNTDLIPMLQQVLTINPAIKIMATPWSPPAWMKSNTNTVGGSLLTTYYGVYANYLVKYIQAMQAKGIPITYLTIQNEPENPNNNPSMVMTATEQANFIKNNLGPAFQAAGIATKIIVFDHNCDHPIYPMTVLGDAAARPYIDGSAFHLYAGDISALSTVHNAYPDKNIYFTEQYTGAGGSFDGDLKWHLKNVLIGSMRNYSKMALEWNLANDPTYSLHTPGGCTDCKGALTINGSNYSRNVAYYIIAHASKFVPAGSTRISSTITSGLTNVAFKTPAGKKVLVVVNENPSASNFNIKYKGRRVATAMPGGAVATYIW